MKDPPQLPFYPRPKLRTRALAQPTPLDANPTEITGPYPDIKLHSRRKLTRNDPRHCEGPATTAVTSEAEDPGPSPTDSVGCEPHGDHWSVPLYITRVSDIANLQNKTTYRHCEGPATTAVPSETEAQDPGPSPTDSVGCEPHGDHWSVPLLYSIPRISDISDIEGNLQNQTVHRHCEGPATTLVTSESADPGPSPTESVGCEPHGDHWHCEGPAETDVDAPESTGAAIPGATVGYAAGALGLAAVLLDIGI